MQRRIDRFDLVIAFAIGQVVNFCISISHAVSFKHHTSVQFTPEFGRQRLRVCL